MRIISGTLKGKKLHGWSKHIPLLRPMMDRVKESVFNILTPYLTKQSLFLDLFSGTGSLALEALSRGARLAHVVENNPACLQIIKKNTQILTNSKALVLHAKDVFYFIKQYKKAFNIIVADPPFALKAGHKIMLALQHSSLIQKETIICIEIGQHEELKTDYASLCLLSQKTFRDKKIYFYICK